MPDPRKNESKKDFISRCMSHGETKTKYPNQKQRVAVCNSLWDKNMELKSIENPLVSSGMVKLHMTAFELSLQASTKRDEYPFMALVAYAGRLSDFPVGGTENLDGGPYRVMIPPNTLKRRIDDLEGKGVFAEANFNSHDNCQQIGEFIHSWVEGDEIDGELVFVAKSSGILHRDINPELVDELVARARAKRLGFSYDIKSVEFELKAVSGGSEKVLEVSDFVWRGATVLERNVAAYRFTQLAAERLQRDKEQTVDIKEFEELLDKKFTAHKESIEESIDKVTERVGTVETSLKEITAKQSELEAGLAKVNTSEPNTQNTPVSGDDSNKQDSGNNQNNTQEPKPSTTSNPPQRGVPMQDFAATMGKVMGEQLSAALKPVAEGINEIKEGLTAQGSGNTKPKGGRLTKDSLELMAKYAPDVEVEGAEDNPLQVVEAAIQHIRSSDNVPSGQRVPTLEALSAERRRLRREAVRGSSQ